ncbi:unnamed protein product, partial [Brassica rapa subsp. trilocularis]
LLCLRPGHVPNFSFDLHRGINCASSPGHSGFNMTTSKRLADRKIEKFDKNITKRGFVPETTAKKGKDYLMDPSSSVSLYSLSLVYLSSRSSGLQLAEAWRKPN